MKRTLVAIMIVVAITIGLGFPRVAVADPNLTPEQEQLLREYGGVGTPAAHPGPVSGTTTYPTTPTPAPASSGPGIFQIVGGLVALGVGLILAVGLCVPPPLLLGAGAALGATDRPVGRWCTIYLGIPSLVGIYVLGGLILGSFGAALGAAVGGGLGAVIGGLSAFITVPGILVGVACFLAPIVLWVKRRRDAAAGGSSSS